MKDEINARKDTALAVDIPTTGWADTITRLSDDSVEADDIEDLLLALNRAEILKIEEILSLLVNYLREKYGECDAGRN